MKRNPGRTPIRPTNPKTVAAALPAVLAVLGVATPAAANQLLLSSTSLSGNLSGNGTSGGYMVMGGTLTVNNATMSNFVTRGGNGSGGGGGMGGAIFINTGATATLNNVNFIGNVVIGGQGGVGTVGGSLNNIGLGAAGGIGANGFTWQDNDSLVGDGNGNGLPGTAAANGANATSGAGGTGGSGGNGQQGWGHNPTLQAAVATASLTVTSTALDITVTIAEGAAACANPFAANLCFTDVAKIAKLTVDSANAVTGLALASKQLADWNDANNHGQVGVGGDGGTGGDGGAAVGTGYGGGSGGTGGAGGVGGTGAAKAGVGGAGGSGGAGGFGGGGGGGGNGGTGSILGTGGSGGAAGFGGGIGSSGTGLSAPAQSGGGGGAGLGGAIFVRDGGSLRITGDALFVGNNALAGGSSNHGVAADNAGADIFMMSGANVTFNPGAGHVVEFRGGSNALSISDTTKPKDYGASETSLLNGAGVTIQSGLVIFGATNTYSGATKLNGGVLRADEGAGLAPYSNLTFNGGVLETSGDFIRIMGTLPGFLQWTGSGGFAAHGGNLNVTLDGGRTLTWASGNFMPTGSTLVFGSTTSDGMALFNNAINLNGRMGRIAVQENADNSDTATVNGVISNGSLTVNDNTHHGTLILTAANTYGGTTNIKAGTLALQGDGSIAASAGVVANGTLDISAANGGSSVTTLSGNGQVTLGTQRLNFTNASGRFGGNITGAGGITVAGGTQTLTGTNTYTGRTVADPGSALALAANGSVAMSSGVTANGTFDISATTGGAAISSLAGTGQVNLGARRLTLTNASDTFDGVIGGSEGITVTGGIQTLTGTHTYTGRTVAESGGTLALAGSGSVAASSGVTANGTFDISATSGGASVTTLSGNGQVNLGAQRLTLTNASDTFDGVIGGSEGITLAGGTQVLTGTNAYTGHTVVDVAGTLALAGSGGIAASSGVTTNGIFDISATTDGASITTLSGNGQVNLGAQRLTLTNASDTFNGEITGAAGITVTGGIQTLASFNSYTGRTIIAPGGTLALKGYGTINASAGVTAYGVLDISQVGPAFAHAMTGGVMVGHPVPVTGASITTLSGTGQVVLGTQRLTLTNASDTFDGVISGTGGITVAAGTEALTNVHTYADRTIIDPNATLALVGNGSIAASSGVTGNGLFDISATGNGATVATLSGTGQVALGNQRLTLANASDTFDGVIAGSEGITVGAGTETLTGTHAYTGRTIINPGATLSLAGTGSIAASSGVTGDGVLDISAATSGASITTLSGIGQVTLGGQTLTLTAASDSYAGTVGGSGNVAVAGGTETLTTAQTYTGGTAIAPNATLMLTGAGGIASSNRVTNNGLLDIAGTQGASLISLAGGGVVSLGSQNLTFTNGADSFAGVINGSGGVVAAGGAQALSGTNTFTGRTLILPNATLGLAGTGSIAASAGVVTDGTFNISATTNGAAIQTLSGVGQVVLGTQRLTLTNASDTFGGVIAGDGGLAVAGGTQVLTGANTYAGGTRINNATLVVGADGALGGASSGLAIDNGTLRYSTGFASARSVSLSNVGRIDTSNQAVALSGTISGSGQLLASGGGVLTLSGVNTYTGGTTITENTTLAVGADSALGATTGGLTINSGKLLALASFNIARPITVDANGVIDSAGYSVRLTGPVTMNVTENQTLAFDGTAHVLGPLVLDAQGLNVGPNSTLRGTGTIGSLTTVSGTLAPGNSPGTLTFTAPVTLMPNAVLSLDIDGTGTGTEAGNYSRVIVQGANSLAAAGVIQPVLRGITGEATNTYVPPVGQSFTAIQADGGVSGTFQGLTQPADGLLPGTRFDALYTPNALTLYVTPASYANLGPLGISLTPNQASTGASFDALRPTPGLRTDAATSDVLAKVFVQPTGALPYLLDHSAGTVYGDAIMTGLESSRLFGNTIADQAAARRGAMLGSSANAVSDGRGWTTWVTGFGQTTQLGASGNTSAASTNGGAAAGMDVPVTSDLRLGIAAGYARSHTSSGATGATDNSNLGFISGYGTWTCGRYFVDAQGGVTIASYDTRRGINILGLTARGDASGFGGNAQLDVGRVFDLGAFQLQPTVGLRYDSLGHGALTESGASVLSLAVDSGDASSLRATAGVRAQTTFALGSGYQLTPTARVMWAHELGDVSTTTTASFVGAPGAPMRSTSAKTGADGALVGIGAGLGLPNGMTAFGGYGADVRNNSTSQAFTVGLRWHW